MNVIAARLEEDTMKYQSSKMRLQSNVLCEVLAVAPLLTGLAWQ